MKDLDPNMKENLILIFLLQDVPKVVISKEMSMELIFILKKVVYVPRP